MAGSQHENATEQIVPGFELPARVWRQIGWRALEPLTRPAPKPFDREGALARLSGMEAKFVRTLNAKGGYPALWARVIPHAMDREEALFWLHAQARISYLRPPVEAHAQLEAMQAYRGSPERIKGSVIVTSGEPPPNPTPGKPYFATQSPPDLTWGGNEDWGRPFVKGPAAGLRVLVHLLEPAELNDLVLARLERAQMWTARAEGQEVIEAFGRVVLPYLSREERERLRARVAPSLAVPERTPWEVGANWCLAALLGMHEQVEARVEGLLTLGTAPHERVFRLVLGQSSPERIVSTARALELTPSSPEELELWLAATGVAGLELAQAWCPASSDTDLARVLLQVAVPEVVPAVVGLLGKSATGKLARKWLAKQGPIALAGLVAMDRSGGSKEARLAQGLFEELRQAHPEVDLSDSPSESEPGGRAQSQPLATKEPEEARPALPQAVAQALAAVEALPPLRAGRKPDWPWPTLGSWAEEDRLQGGVVRAMATAELLSGAPPGPCRLLLEAIAAERPALEREAYAWRLYEAWELQGFPPKQEWVLHALGWWGSDETVERLAALILAWPEENQHLRANRGLRCLAQIGSLPALFALARIGQNRRRKTLSRRAEGLLNQVARARGLDADQLGDLLVPSCGLNAEGSRVFAYGGRSFRFVLSPERTPLVSNEAGKLLKAPPRPGKKDDPVLAPAALAAWRACRKEALATLALQSARLELAMVSSRRWTPELFAARWVEHPLARALIGVLLWGDFHEGRLESSFRVTRERAYLDLEGKPVVPRGQIGLVHPLHLEAATRSRWQEVWDQEDLLAPFPQLEREVSAIATQDGADRLCPAEPLQLDPRALRSRLSARGWRPGPAEEDGALYSHLKLFSGVACLATLIHGHLEGSGQEDGPVAVEGCEFARTGDGPQLLLQDVDPVVLSEVQRDLEGLRSSD